MPYILNSDWAEETELTRLRDENARLREALTDEGIEAAQRELTARQQAQAEIYRLSKKLAELAPEERSLAAGLCSDCPPVGYGTDRTRCLSCPRSLPKIDQEDIDLTYRRFPDNAQNNGPIRYAFLEGIRHERGKKFDRQSAEIARLTGERDEAEEKLSVANTGGLPLLYDIRAALGWNDKTSLSILADGVRRVRRALQTWDTPTGMGLEELALAIKARVVELEQANEVNKARIEELLEELAGSTEEGDDHL